MLKKCLTILLLSLSATSFAGVWRFNSLTVENGLSNNTVSAIEQDGMGRIWMATRGGVNRFDGNDVKWFEHSSDDETTIQSNFVNTIFKDRQGKLWACSADGLAAFNPDLDRFERVITEGIQSIEYMMQLDAHHYLLATRDHSVIYDSKSGTCVKATIEGSDITVYSSAVSNGEILLGTGKRTIEFVKYTPEGGLERIRDKVKLPARATAMLETSGGHVWIGLNEGQLMIYEGHGLMMNVPASGIPQIRIEAIEQDGNGTLWIGTKEGVYLLSTTDGKSERLVSDKFDSHSISSNAVRDIFKDAEGNIWVSSTYGGISCHAMKKSAFRTIDSHTQPEGLSGDIVRSVAVDSKGRIWAGTRYNGINCCNLADGSVRSFDMDQVLSIYCPEDNGNVIYAGTYRNGIIEIDIKNGRQKQVTGKTDINDMVAAYNGKLWVGSLSGLFLFDKSKHSLERVLGQDLMLRVMDLMLDSNGRLWVGAKDCLKVLEVTRDNGISEVTPDALKDLVRIQHMYESPDGTVWIGTSDGLLSFRDGLLERVEETSGLRNMPINGVISDDDGTLWVITDNGLCRYNPQSGAGRFYYTGDGLPGNQYSSGGICKDGKGTIYTGNSHGLCYFRTDEVSENELAVAPFVSQIWINNRQVLPGDETRVLKKDVTLTSSIVLSHRQSAILLRFACPDYNSWGHIHYKYMLQGFDHDWNYADDRDATYTNLPQGHYTFKVKCSNSDGVWAEGEDTLRIYVRPAWYRTKVAWTVWILLILSGMAYGATTLTLRILRRNEARLADMQEQYDLNVRRARLHSYAKEGIKLNAQGEKFLSTVLKHIEENVHDPEYSVEDLAGALGMSRSNLNIKLKEVTGHSPIDLLKKVRIEKACELIRRGDLPMKEVASKAGFASLSYFSVAFKKAMEMTPGEYASHSGRNSVKGKS